MTIKIRSLSRAAIVRIEGISNIRDAVKTLLDDGFEKSNIIQYIRQFK